MQSLPEILIDAAWQRHHKRNSWGGRQIVFQTILGQSLDWDRFERNHESFCAYWDRHGWQYCTETLLGWVENGMCAPPPEAGRRIEPARVASSSQWITGAELISQMERKAS